MGVARRLTDDRRLVVQPILFHFRDVAAERGFCPVDFGAANRPSAIGAESL